MAVSSYIFLFFIVIERWKMGGRIAIFFHSVKIENNGH